MKYGILLIIGLLITSCTSTNRGTNSQILQYQVIVESYGSDNNIKNKVYYLTPEDSKTNVNDLQFQEFSKYIDNILINRGYQKTLNASEANLLISLWYWISEPELVLANSYLDPNQTSTVYTRFLRITCYDYDEYKKNKEEKKCWNTFASSRGYSSDIRAVFPYLVVGSMDYIGRSSGRRIFTNIDEYDFRVTNLINSSIK